MRKIAAGYVFPISSPPIKHGIVILNDDGTILDIVDNRGQLKEIEALEYYNGILVPGFVNAHCHLELSYLKKLGSFKGLPSFIKAILKERFNIPENLHDIIKSADKEMSAEGIVAVGDIMNDNFSFRSKKESKIFYQSFSEIFDMTDANADFCFEKGIKLIDEAKSNEIIAYLTPHAPYTVTKKLFGKIKSFCENNCKIYSLHNQESYSENNIFNKKSGELYDFMCSAGVDFSSWQGSESSIKAISDFFPKNLNILLIHNIYTSKEDVEYLKTLNSSFYFVLCPKSNLIIEDKLPDIEMLYNSGFPICIGTDSYASNTRLSILEEMKVISKNFPQVPLSRILEWATINGAKALNIEDQFGSLEVGKKPGVNLIQGIDYSTMTLTPDSFIKPLV